MKAVYSLLFGAALGASSIFIYSFYPPAGLIVSLLATGLGIWATGRLWGKRSYKFIASIAWALVVLRAGFPGLNEEYLIQIARLRMVVDPEIQLSKNIHKKTGIQYMKVKGFWLNDVGVKERKYFKSLGRFDQYPNGTEDESAILDGRKKIREDIYAEYLKLYSKK